MAIAFGLGSLFCAALAHADVEDKMKYLIEHQQVKEAYELGTAHPELLGEPLFDYYYGVAAVDSGRISLGVLSLERVLLNDPNNDLARLELARAYFALGDYQRAQEEFETVKKHQPPPGVTATVNLYLDTIKAKEARYQTSYGVYVELGMGYNNNLNSATALNTITLPFIGPVALGTSSQPQKSVFGFDSAGVNVNIPIDTNLSGFADVNTRQQTYSQVKGYNLNVTNGATGLKYADGANLYRTWGAAGANFWLSSNISCGYRKI
jgi:tetratricopeptide (TPR) repeat protein